MAEVRRIFVPTERVMPLKENWLKIFTPVIKDLKLQIRFNVQSTSVEIRTCENTKDGADLQRAADFVKAFIFGFEVDDALVLLRTDDLFVETFEIEDVKTLKGDHRSNAIGRVVGKRGTTKYSIENISNTQIVITKSKIHILGGYDNIAIARRAICSLIMGYSSSKVIGQLKSAAARM